MFVGTLSMTIYYGTARANILQQLSWCHNQSVSNCIRVISEPGGACVSTRKHGVKLRTLKRP